MFHYLVQDGQTTAGKSPASPGLTRPSTVDSVSGGRNFAEIFTAESEAPRSGQHFGRIADEEAEAPSTGHGEPAPATVDVELTSEYPDNSAVVVSAEVNDDLLEYAAPPGDEGDAVPQTDVWGAPEVHDSRNLGPRSSGLWAWSSTLMADVPAQSPTAKTEGHLPSAPALQITTAAISGGQVSPAPISTAQQMLGIELSQVPAPDLGRVAALYSTPLSVSDNATRYLTPRPMVNLAGTEASGAGPLPPADATASSSSEASNDTPAPRQMPIGYGISRTDTPHLVAKPNLLARTQETALIVMEPNGSISRSNQLPPVSPDSTAALLASRERPADLRASQSAMNSGRWSERSGLPSFEEPSTLWPSPVSTNEPDLDRAPPSLARVAIGVAQPYMLASSINELSSSRTKSVAMLSKSGTLDFVAPGPNNEVSPESHQLGPAGTVAPPAPTQNQSVGVPSVAQATLQRLARSVGPAGGSDAASRELNPGSSATPFALAEAESSNARIGSAASSIVTAQSAQPPTTQIAHAAIGAKGARTELLLDPEELGKVRLRMVSDENSITLHVHAERPETLELLRRNIETLAQEFRDLGFDDVTFAFGDEAAAEQTPDWFEDEEDASDPDFPGAIPEPANNLSRGGPDGRLDIRL